MAELRRVDEPGPSAGDFAVAAYALRLVTTATGAERDNLEESIDSQDAEGMSRVARRLSQNDLTRRALRALEGSANV